MRRNGSGRTVNNVKPEHISPGDPKPGSKPPMQKVGSSTDKDSLDSSKLPSTEAPPKEDMTKMAMHVYDSSAATFLDVAVLRCLFITLWQEEGIYWALHYMYNRLRDINDESVGQQQPRKRSNSLPIPKIEVSLYQSNDSRKGENGNKDFIEVPEPRDVSLLTGLYTIGILGFFFKLINRCFSRVSIPQPIKIRRVSTQTIFQRKNRQETKENCRLKNICRD
ncbi:unnamed protein product [Diabrotica balteata]|uniref:Uncharacterized protein n=1 Tax=Diabrotica balteata TaxID=107213 RepID=A0A9N9T4G4_DIABA|nr:unnamed protein product [Diabrotica balteata]